MDLDAQAALLYERVAAVADATTADRVVGSARPGVTFRRSAPCTAFLPTVAKNDPAWAIVVAKLEGRLPYSEQRRGPCLLSLGARCGGGDRGSSSRSAG